MDRRFLLWGGVGLFAAATLAADRLLVLGDWSSADIPDASRPIEIRLTAPPGDRPTGLSVCVSGETDGEFDIAAGREGPTRMGHVGGGQVDWRVSQPWAERECTLRYRPVGRVTGRLTVRYQFR